MNADEIYYVLDRLDMAHVNELAGAAGAAWDGGAAGFELCYRPGDGTHYALLFTIIDTTYLPLLGAPGGGTGGMAPTSGLGFPRDRGYAVVYYAQKNTAQQIYRREFLHPSYLAPLMEQAGPASTLAVAVLLNEITGQDPGWRDRLIENAAAAEGGA